MKRLEKALLALLAVAALLMWLYATLGDDRPSYLYPQQEQRQ